MLMFWGDPLETHFFMFHSNPLADSRNSNPPRVRVPGWHPQARVVPHPLSQSGHHPQRGVHLLVRRPPAIQWICGGAPRTPVIPMNYRGAPRTPVFPMNFRGAPRTPVIPNELQGCAMKFMEIQVFPPPLGVPLGFPPLA